MLKCSKCKTIVKKFVSRKMGEITGRYTCKCLVPNFPLIKVK